MEGRRLLEALPDATLVVSGGSRRADEAPVAQGYAAAAQVARIRERDPQGEIVRVG
ncbi:hypothetical protein TVNIR_0726 [Thioalkalivibrio nitratireducens DSM 14787]|uniref:Uncharacterized protein n=2 Tax=Thioalkalivibrio nitratireducens TaxID=186931 RepID=L0DTW4_THIND|nr:hypothetical protein TVNIR_0726 [Thioalkalivibrio nitratireducens DSM 14787]